MNLRLALLALTFVLGACSRGKASPPTQADASAEGGVALAATRAPPDGAALYASHCAVCHGADATGYKADFAPSLVSPTFLESATDDYLRGAITFGRPGTSMAPYGAAVGGPFDGEALASVVAWIRGHGKPAMPQLPQPVGQGDATRGGVVYAARCASCHGTPGARGTAVHLANPRFLEFASDAFIRWAIVNGRPGTPMEAWKGKLSDAEIDDVGAFIRAYQTAAPSGTLPPPTGKEPMVLNPRGRDPSFTLRADACLPNVKCTEDPRFVSVDQVNQALSEKRKMVIIDARPPSDWMRVHIPGAVSVPYHDMKRLDELKNDGTWVIAYCACPHHLSGDIVDALRKRGFKHAVVLDEGILEWHRRGYPVVAAEGILPPPTEPARTGAHP